MWELVSVKAAIDVFRKPETVFGFTP